MPGVLDDEKELFLQYPDEVLSIQTLALNIVKEHFGEKAERVCRTMVQNGILSLDGIMKKLHSSDPSLCRKDVAHIFSILLQQNLLCVKQKKAFKDSKGKLIQPPVLYAFDSKAACQRLRFGKLTRHVKKTLTEDNDKEYGEHASFLIQEILVRGRGSADQLVEGAIRRLTHERVSALNREKEKRERVKKRERMKSRNENDENCDIEEMELLESQETLKIKREKEEEAFESFKEDVNSETFRAKLRDVVHDLLRRKYLKNVEFLDIQKTKPLLKKKKKKVDGDKRLKNGVSSARGKKSVGKKKVKRKRSRNRINSSSEEEGPEVKKMKIKKENEGNVSDILADMMGLTSSSGQTSTVSSARSSRSSSPKGLKKTVVEDEYDNDYGNETFNVSKNTEDFPLQINMDQFIYEYRVAFLKRMAKSIFGKKGKFLLGQIFKWNEMESTGDDHVTMNDNDDNGGKMTFHFSGRDIWDFSSEDPSQLYFEDHISMYVELSKLATGPFPFVTKFPNVGNVEGGNFAIHVENCIEKMRQMTIANFISNRFGQQSARIFRMLSEKHYMEATEISKRALTPLKETRTHLFKLFKAGFLKLQEVPKRSDHNPQTTIYVWTVRNNTCCFQLHSDINKMILNLRLKQEKEMQTHSALIEKKTREIATKRELQKFKRFWESHRELTYHIHELEDMCWLLADF
eukprot:g5918.t1